MLQNYSIFQVKCSKCNEMELIPTNGNDIKRLVPTIESSKFFKIHC